MNQLANEYYDSLLRIYLSEESSLTMKYRQMRELLERLCRQSMQNEQLQMTDLSARISYLASIASLSRNAQNQLHTFRLTSNAVFLRSIIIDVTSAVSSAQAPSRHTGDSP